MPRDPQKSLGTSLLVPQHALVWNWLLSLVSLQSLQGFCRSLSIPVDPYQSRFGSCMESPRKPQKSGAELDEHSTYLRSVLAFSFSCLCVYPFLSSPLCLPLFLSPFLLLVLILLFICLFLFLLSFICLFLFLLFFFFCVDLYHLLSVPKRNLELFQAFQKEL